MNLWFEIGWTLIALAVAVAGLVLIRQQRRVQRSPKHSDDRDTTSL